MLKGDSLPLGQSVTR